ncbi:MAG: hypothetical protein PVJ57_05885 [Phycisphaerae bacterium]|jgi:4-diphosphocytidyl-2C-methyl-D-erythritol kinase
MPPLTRSSPAKINLTLRVVGLRPDGFHEIESLVARVSLHDTITAHPAPDGRRTLSCDDPSLPTDRGNLALRAADELARATGSDFGVHLELAKRIPAGAGLGGGSSNAATTLALLNDLWSLGVADLARIGAALGSDVPLFFHSPLCILRGRGDQIEDVFAGQARGDAGVDRTDSESGADRSRPAAAGEQLERPPASVPAAEPSQRAGDRDVPDKRSEEGTGTSPAAATEHSEAPRLGASPLLRPAAPAADPLTTHAILLLGGGFCRTPAVYAAWDRDPPTEPRPPLANVLARLADPPALSAILFNDLEEPALATYPDLRVWITAIRRLCPGPVRMTGSGSAFFTLCTSAEEARDLADRLAADGPQPLQAVSVTFRA